LGPFVLVDVTVLPALDLKSDYTNNNFIYFLLEWFYEKIQKLKQLNNF